jgi:hypothetical protein
MADNISVKDAAAAVQTMRTSESGGAHTPHHIPSVGGAPVDQSNPLPVSASARTCLGRQTLSVTTGAVATLTAPQGAVAALLQVDGGSSVSLTLDGVTAPTASVGLRLDDGVMHYVDTALAGVKLIARTATVNVQIAYFDRA